MKLQPFLIAACSGLIMFVGQTIFSIASGGFSLGSQLSEVKSDIKLIRQELLAQKKLQEYKFDQLEKDIKTVKSK